MFLINIFEDWILIRVIETDAYYAFFFLRKEGTALINRGTWNT
jgi:hypothetical protein